MLANFGEQTKPRFSMGELIGLLSVTRHQNDLIKYDASPIIHSEITFGDHAMRQKISDTLGHAAHNAKRGRPASPLGRHTRNAEAARRYRARKRMEREARRDLRQLLRSAIIDLSAVPAWRRGGS
jgi:hypothetical protein